MKWKLEEWDFFPLKSKDSKIGSKEKERKSEKGKKDCPKSAYSNKWKTGNKTKEKKIKKKKNPIKCHMNLNNKIFKITCIARPIKIIRKTN